MKIPYPIRPGATRKDFWALAAGALVLAAGVDALAQPSGHGLPAPTAKATGSEPTQDEKWRRRFPQPVLVSDLIGRQMLDREQGVLGHIETLVRTSAGGIVIAFARRRLFVFRGDTVAVPAKVTALLGKFVMILDLSPDEIDRLPVFSPAGTSAIDRNSRIDMALTKH